MDWSDPESVGRLVIRLLDEGGETAWIEFKEGYFDPDRLGEYISSLSNSAAIEGQEAGYLVFGIHDGSLEVVGTSIDLNGRKQGNQDLHLWLKSLLSPSVFLTWGTGVVNNKQVFAIRVDAAREEPTKFKGIEYIRVGPHQKKLSSHPELEKRLWRTLEHSSFESRAAASTRALNDALDLLDIDAYYNISGRARPHSSETISQDLQDAKVLTSSMDDEWQVTNLGALLYSHTLERFDRLARKTIRVVQYEGTSRLRARQEKEFAGGYVTTFAAMMDYISALLPANEIIEKSGLRLDGHLFPLLAVRELTANAVIHQDLAAIGRGPMVEIFDDRVEISNPGVPLLDPMRFIDASPRSRNEKLARAMRLHGFCEERGSGWDKVAFEVELHQLPSPLVSVDEDTTKVTLYAPKPLATMDRFEKARAVYQHACLRYVSSEPTNNTSIRKRFGLSKNRTAQASKIIREAVDEGLIVVYDATVGVRSIRYVPFWAGSRQDASEI